jgi:prepilin-type processing-associated H-X9-DG protein
MLNFKSARKSFPWGRSWSRVAGDQTKDLSAPARFLLFTVESITNGCGGYHPGDVNISLMDGSVRMVNDDIHLVIWQAHSTRAGGEVTENGD